jgi:transcriptional regulator with XRE-family HTH domain
MGNEFKELRRRKLLTQKELAAAVGVTLSAVQRWEDGTRYPRPAQLRKLCGVFGIAPGELLAALDAIRAGDRKYEVRTTKYEPAHSER